MAADLVLAEGELLDSPNKAIVLLARNGVRHGLQHAILATLPQTPGPTAVRVALGEPALPGTDGRVCYGFPLPADESAYEPPAEPRVVQEGEVLGRRHPAFSGQLGRTVTGRTLAIAAVQDPPFVAGAGAEISMDGHYVVAARHGVPHLEGEAVVVRPLVRIPHDIGPEDGSLDVDGDVVIAGHVEHPAAIVASGDVYIQGGVQGAHIRAGGRIVVQGGVRQDARLEAGQGITMKFGEQSTVVAGGLVVVHEDLIRCTVEAPRARVGGAVVGGDLALVEWLEAGALGSEYAAATRVAVVPPAPPEDPTRAFARERRELVEQLTRLAPLLDENRRLAKDPRNEGAREMATKLVGLIAHLQARDRELAALIADTPELPAGPRPFARVVGQVHPGVSLQVGAQHLRPASAIPGSTFLEGAGAVEIAPYDLSLERTFA